MNIREKVAQLPINPGVYLYKDARGKVIYVGKAKSLRSRVRSYFSEERLAVLAVAHALETNKTLSGDDVMAVIEGRQGAIVDGRPYHTDEFRRLAEAYHAEAMAAHPECEKTVLCGHTN